jgi:putative acetyltransferase
MLEDAAAIRDGRPDDWPALERLYAAAFPEEDLAGLVRALLDSPAVAQALVAVTGEPQPDPEAGPDAVVGHLAVTACRLAPGALPAALLGPLAVAPARQRQGLGGRLIEAGLERARRAGVGAVFVLGDPAYYGRFGFRAERSVAPPYPLPEAWEGAWQSLALAGPPPHGTLVVPPLWLKPELWSP